MTTPDKQRLAQLLVDTGAVRFGRFTTRSGRSSPYFVNLGAIHHGEQIAELADLYAGGIAEHFAGAPPSCRFGPPYKAVELLRSRSARIVGLLIAVDRMERGSGSASALAELQAEFGFATAALITIEEVVELAAVAAEQRSAVRRHLQRYRAAG